MIIIQAIVIAFMVVAIHVTYQEDEIFEFVSRWGEKHIPEHWQKPIFSCPKCMTFWYGIPIYLIGHELNIGLFIDARIQVIAFTIIVAIGINTAYLNFLSKMEDIADK